MSQWHGRCVGCGMYYGPMPLPSGAVLRCKRCGWIVKEVSNGPGQAPTGGTPANPGVGAMAGAGASQGADPEQGASPGLAIDALGPLDGWRAWRAPAGEGTLHSIWATYKWTPGKNTAVCLRNRMMLGGYLPMLEPSPPHDVPSRIGSGHRCGFYACLGPDFEAMNGESPLSFREAVSVFGRVELWGRVYTYEKGYRAQYARITALMRLWKPEHEEAMAALAERYGVPIEDPPAGLGRWVEEVCRHPEDGVRSTSPPAGVTAAWHIARGHTGVPVYSSSTATNTSANISSTAYWPPLEEPEKPRWREWVAKHSAALIWTIGGSYVGFVLWTVLRIATR